MTKQPIYSCNIPKTQTKLQHILNIQWCDVAKSVLGVYSGLPTEENPDVPTYVATWAC